MGLRKGTTNNPEGRPKGSTNKITDDIRDLFKSLLEENLKTLQKDLKKLSPKDRVMAILKIAEFVTPRLKSIDLESKFVTHEYMEYQRMKAEKEYLENMTDEELQKELERLRGH